GRNSTRVLHVVNNFQPNRSEEEFFDCVSGGDSDRDCKSKKSTSKKMCSCKSSKAMSANKCPNKSETSRLDDPDALRSALERIAHGTQMMLQNFEHTKSGGRKPCSATLEITARLITEGNENNPNCQLNGRPVTMKMPLEFDPTTGQLGTRSATSSRHIACKDKCAYEQPEQSKTGTVSSKVRRAKYKLASLHAFNSEVFAGSCTPTAPFSTNDTESRKSEELKPVTVPLPVPGFPHSPQAWEEKQTEPITDDSQITTEVEWKPEPLPPLPADDETKMLDHGEIGDVSVKSDIEQPKGAKRYFMALPQHRDFSNCSPCRYYPSPIMDEEGNIFCPGQCGCCQCAWKKRSFDHNREHTNIKVCRCVQRGTIFTNYNQRENCSQISDFDFCPCREKAEAKFLELYNCEMWSSPTATRGPEVQIDQIVELLTPTQPRSP
ncbi:hypothetical protein KR093_011640, partial [Drosophila rubida]